MKQALYYSIASAACVGLLAGGAMKLGPDALSDRGGPQILMPSSAKHSQQQDYGAGQALFTSQNGELPEYVVGTDWTRPQYALTSDAYYDVAYQDAEQGYAPTAPAPNPNIDDAIFVAPVKISSPPKPTQVSYPSIDGDVVGRSDDADQSAESDGPALIHVVEAQGDSDTLPS